MGTKSAVTHEFHRGKVDGDGSCLYSAFRYVNGTLESIDNQRLRRLVAVYILEHKNLHLPALQSGVKCKTIKEYCTKIEKHNLWGGEPEFRALVMLSRKVICLVSKTKTAQDKYKINILNYGEDVESFRECVYILYDEEKKHYDPLHVVNKQNLDDIVTIFQRNDGVVLQLLDKFIQEELYDDTLNISDCPSPSDELGSPSDINCLNKMEQMFHMVVPKSMTNVSCKENVNSILSKPTNVKQLQIPIDDKYYGSNKQNKSTEPVVNELSARDENNLESVSINQLLLTDDFRNASDLSTNQPTTTHVPTGSDKCSTAKMRFEIEPARKFRGRTKHEYKPKKALKRNGQPSTPLKPRHFADRNDNNVLNLLIPEKYLSPNAEHRLEIYLVTREIDGCTHINLRFKFQVDRTDKKIPDVNPMYVPFDITQLKDHSKGIKQLQLRLVVLMDTNPELMETEQPLPIFSILNDGSAITTKYTSHPAFKKAYHLDDLRFAINLCQKQPGEKEFHRCDNIQYISEISTQDREYKKSVK